MKSKEIEISPCKNNIGAFINLNLINASNKQIKEVKKTLNEYGVVFFRNQHFNSTQYVSFAKN